jgi:hypothetical protein
MHTFTHKFINNWKVLSTARIGFEFEFYSNSSFIKTMELLNHKLGDNIEVWAFNKYHSDFELTDTKFKIEPDYSGGSNMVELITGPIEWVNAKFTLIKILKFIKLYGYTDEHCSLHVNISFNDESDIQVKNCNIIKLILNFDENFVYEKFPNRKNNIYAKSIKYIIPFEEWHSPEVALNTILQSLKLPENSKYYGINFNKVNENYLEFRYIGGANYEDKLDNILEIMDYFIISLHESIVNDMDMEDNIKLLAYLEENINWFNNFTTYEDFLSISNNIYIEVDRNSDFDIINSMWWAIKNKLFTLIKSCNNIQHLLLNYNTITNRIELVNGILDNVFQLQSYDFIKCTITNFTLLNCDIVDCEINHGHLYNCNVYDSKIINTKLKNCKASDWSDLEKCVFDGGTLDCKMRGGVFRSGVIGEYAEFDSNVKMVNNDSFWNVEVNNKKDIIDGK